MIVVKHNKFIAFHDYDVLLFTKGSKTFNSEHLHGCYI
jgi:hypothetical protein